MRKIRVLVVEDSPTVRQRVVEALGCDPEIEVVGEAGDGKRAVDLCEQVRPDLITMDMMMPVMSGLAATEYIMACRPTPILIVSASFNRGELFKIYDALAAGAVDVLEKPTGGEPEGVWEQRLRAAVKVVAKIKVITHLRARVRGRAPDALRESDRTFQTKGTTAAAPEVVAVGASTGGPGAIVEVLRRLPAQFQVPILVVLHMNEPFGSAFTDWLDAQIDRRAVTPAHGDPVARAKGRVMVAPCGRHLVVREGRMFLTEDQERHSCRPSVDVLFESVAAGYGAGAAACLLTGMGRDGAHGLLKIREAGGMTIAQDEASSVVYGMPREAKLIGAATHVLPVKDIGPRLAARQGVGMEVSP